MKKSTTRRLLAMCLCLTLITVSLIGGTLAKYTTTINANTVTGAVAAWSFKIANDENGTSQTTALSYILEGSGAKNNAGQNTIAPGDGGSFDIVIDASGSDVAVEYIVKFTDVPTNVTLKYGNNELAANSTITGTIAQADVSSKQIVTINWTMSDADFNTTASLGGDLKFDITGSQAGSGTTTTASGQCTVGTSAAQ